MAIDWESIKTEYIHTDITQRALADKYGVSPRQVAYRSKREGWFLEKQAGQLCETGRFQLLEYPDDGQADSDRRAGSNRLGGGSDRRAGSNRLGGSNRRAGGIRALAQRLCQKCSLAIDGLGDDVDPQRLKQLVQSVKDLKEIVKSDGADDGVGQLEQLVKGLLKL